MMRPCTDSSSVGVQLLDLDRAWREVCYLERQLLDLDCDLAAIVDEAGERIM